ncbi:MAG: type II toxin-antitoxin system RelE/ParE family toxin [Synergistaceae bacterium]|nr:type II toxin-antitoxin system RelE/ParE family toxin [Synergistaceae bacterium]
MEAKPFTVVYYETEDGDRPFIDWLLAAKNPLVIRALRSRLKRVTAGDLGDHKYLEDGIWELRLIGLGIRIYFARIEDTILLLLWGGGKNTPKDQRRDIAKAKKYWNDFQNRDTET